MGWQERYKRVMAAGFTIVELLVVVTVIGIIASITIVTYQQVQIRAENAKTVQAANQYIKAVVSYQARNGTYPISSTGGCLGTVASCVRVSGSTNCFGLSSGATYDTAFGTIMLTEVAPLPEPSTQSISCSGNTYLGGYYEKNDTQAGKSAWITYFLRGNQTCTTKYGTLTRNQQDDLTQCRVALPTLP